MSNSFLFHSNCSSHFFLSTGDVIAPMKRMNIMTVPSSTKLVGIALATSVCAEEVTTAIGKALAAKGVTNVVVSLVESILILPYLVKEMTQKCETVLAIAVVEEDGAPMADLIAQTLFEIGLAQNCPVVSATMSPSNVLELKAMLPVKARSWASSIVSLLALDVVAPISLSAFEVRNNLVIVDFAMHVVCQQLSNTTILNLI